MDSLSGDGRTAVKLMIPSHRVSETVYTAAAAGYRPTWLDAVNYQGTVFFNVIWTRNDDEVRSSRRSAIVLVKKLAHTRLSSVGFRS